MTSHESSLSHGRRSRRREAPLSREFLESRALRYAARWETTAAGLGKFLERKIRERGELEEDEVARFVAMIPGIVETLVDRDYVNDKRFAEMTIGRLGREGRSTSQIRQRLREKGVPEPIATELLESLDLDADLQAAWRLAARRRLGPYCLDPDSRRQNRERHLAVLARRGFGIEIAKSVIDARQTLEADEAEQPGHGVLTR